MDHSDKTQVEQLQIQLNYVRGKLNKQKTEIEQLTRARDFWRNKYLNGGTGIAIGEVTQVDFIDSHLAQYKRVSLEAKVRAEVLYGACRSLAAYVQPGNVYVIRVADEIINVDNLPAKQYKVRITLWKDGAHGTADTDTRE